MANLRHSKILEHYLRILLYFKNRQGAELTSSAVGQFCPLYFIGYLITLTIDFRNGGLIQMKNIKFKKLLVLFAIIIFIQNGAIIVENTGNGIETGSEDDVAPCSDFPGYEDSFD